MPCSNINSQFLLGAIHWLWEFRSFLGSAAHSHACLQETPELINQEAKPEIQPVLRSSRNLAEILENAAMSSITAPILQVIVTLHLFIKPFCWQKMANVTSLTVRVRQPSPPPLNIVWIPGFWGRVGGGGGVFSKAPAARQIYTALKNNKPRWMLGWVGRSRRQGNHLRGREPWGIEEKEASEYVFSSAKPISKWLPAPCAWKLKRENRKI